MREGGSFDSPPVFRLVTPPPPPPPPFGSAPRPKIRGLPDRNTIASGSSPRLNFLHQRLILVSSWWRRENLSKSIQMWTNYYFFLFVPSYLQGAYIVIGTSVTNIPFRMEFLHFYKRNVCVCVCEENDRV